MVKLNADDKNQTYQYVIIHQSLSGPAKWHDFWQMLMGLHWYCDDDADIVPT